MRPLDGTDPRHIGPYALLGRLGTGGMGTVYLGRSAGGRTVAVEVVRHGPLPEAALWTLTAGIAEALVHVHAARLIHRDLNRPT